MFTTATGSSPAMCTSFEWVNDVESNQSNERIVYSIAAIMDTLLPECLGFLFGVDCEAVVQYKYNMDAAQSSQSSELKPKVDGVVMALIAMKQ